MTKQKAIKQAKDEMEKNNAYAVIYRCDGVYTCMPYYSLDAYDMMHDELKDMNVEILFHDGMIIKY